MARLASFNALLVSLVGMATAYSGNMSTIPYSGGKNGVCGVAIGASDMAVALPTGFLTGANDAHCNKTLNIIYNGITTVAYALDTCADCHPSDLGVTAAVWNKAVGSSNTASVEIEWDGI